MDEPLLEVCGLQKRFLSRGAEIRAVDGVSFSIGRGELFGLVGESGSGKSTVARCAAGLYRPDGGEIRLAGSFQRIFQDASGSLNPRMTAEELICEPLEILRRGGRAERRKKARELLGLVGLGEELAGCYPGDLSGGQQQRIAVARALAPDPDQPAASLDMSVRAQILNLFLRLRRERGMSVLLISHDLAAVRRVCGRIGVMKAGRLVELGETAEVCGHPRHPYTRALLEAASSPDFAFAGGRGSVEPGSGNAG